MASPEQAHACLLGQRRRAVAFLWPLLAAPVLGFRCHSSALCCLAAAAVGIPRCRPPRLGLPLLAQLLARVLVPRLPVCLLALARAAAVWAGVQQHERHTAGRCGVHAASHLLPCGSAHWPGGVVGSCHLHLTSMLPSCTPRISFQGLPCRSGRTRAARPGANRPSAAARRRCRLPAAPWRACATRARPCRLRFPAPVAAAPRPRHRRPAAAACRRTWVSPAVSGAGPNGDGGGSSGSGGRALQQSNPSAAGHNKLQRCPAGDGKAGRRAVSPHEQDGGKRCRGGGPWQDGAYRHEPDSAGMLGIERRAGWGRIGRGARETGDLGGPVHGPHNATQARDAVDALSGHRSTNEPTWAGHHLAPRHDRALQRPIQRAFPPFKSSGQSHSAQAQRRRTAGLWQPRRAPGRPQTTGNCPPRRRPCSGSWPSSMR